MAPNTVTAELLRHMSDSKKQLNGCQYPRNTSRILTTTMYMNEEYELIQYKISKEIISKVTQLLLQISILQPNKYGLCIL